jgi:hypothetical protein
MIITESERQRIKSMYGLPSYKKEYIFELCTTVDGRYFILQDEVFDIKEQKQLGNLWSSIDVFKTIFSNVTVEDKTGKYNQIKESILSIPILEGKENLYELRNILLEWSFTENTWLGKQLSSSGKAIVDTVTSGLEGLKKFGIAISKGEWTEILSLMAKGVKWILRKLKEGMYSTIGMTVDAILVATGIGKSVQWIPWALITALDIYQIVTNDWPGEEANDPMWMKFMTLGFDILGLVSTGVVAKSAKKSLSPLKNMDNVQITSVLEKNPTLKKTIESMISGISKVPSLLSRAQSTISKTFPAGSKFIGSAIDMLKNIMGRFTSSLESLIGKRATSGVKAGASTQGMFYGFEKGAEKYAQYKTGLNSVQLQNLDALSDLSTMYKGKDPFD